jgi:hypothetical protein
MDRDGLLLVMTRINQRCDNQDFRYPVVLPSNRWFVKWVVKRQVSAIFTCGGTCHTKRSVPTILVPYGKGNSARTDSKMHAMLKICGKED